MSVRSLSRVLTPPAIPVDAAGDWDRVEESLGTTLPADYKDYIRIYGTGVINDFMAVFNPFSRAASLNLVEQTRGWLDALRELRDE